MEHIVKRADAEAALVRAFTPASPVTIRDIFQGRTEQTRQILDAVAGTGQHVVLYGERGVGKTSLANILSVMLDSDYIVARANCDSGDSFSQVWEKLFHRIHLSSTNRGVGFLPDGTTKRIPVLGSVQNGNPATVAEIRNAIESLSTIKPCVFVIDEFDRIQRGKTCVR